MTNKYSLISGLKQLNSIEPDSLWAKENKGNLMVRHQQIFPTQIRGLDFYYFKLRPVLATIMILGVILMGSWGTLYAAKNSLPGHPLYTVKRAAEKVRLAVAFNRAEKNVLRAELLNTRVQEAKVLAQKVQEAPDTNIKAEAELVSMAKDIKSEINVLRKEIISQSAVETILDVTFDEGSLPIQDGKKVAEVVLSEDLKKSLEETKEFLAKKDLSTALAKTIELDKKLTAVEATSTPEKIESAPVEPKTILKKGPGSVGSLPASPTSQGGPIKKIKPLDSTQGEQSKDFKVSPIREGEISTGLIREK